MNRNRVNNRRQIQRANKLFSSKLPYLDFGEMDYVCPYCNASYWSVEFSKKNSLKELWGIDEPSKNR
ncbi:hypothetical protein TSAR_012433 [Trichomalopsis sarcophagae]|uniref:Uncharacterized protein n=1 Tax=Trichomalopsis sarcophagae TaxID=543379 RepID=A0A232F285_9HYME|nr:hypothetical protein TSAR_012433 [Trichomalopsis sarcophagae]